VDKKLIINATQPKTSVQLQRRVSFSPMCPSGEVSVQRYNPLDKVAHFSVSELLLFCLSRVKSKAQWHLTSPMPLTEAGENDSKPISSK